MRNVWTKTMSTAVARLSVTIACLLFADLGPAMAQQTTGVGVGGRMTFVRADSAVPDSNTRTFGGLLRARTSPRVALELALDYKSRTTLTEKITDYPFQGSVLLYPVRSTVGLYLLGGVGWYSESVAPLDSAGKPLTGTTSRRFGYHGGVGGEVELGRRATLHLDYRYTFLHFGGDNATDNAGAVPIPGTIGLQDRLKLSHEGSMWTTGLTFFF
ncbi:MAG: outer membrane beta-barrel protein [Vicinamibacterales bacterium]